MFVITIIPLARGITIESLTYFSNQTFTLGDIITIPVRGKYIRGVVLESTPVSLTKTALKAATFSLRKLPPQPNPTRLPTALLATTQSLQTRLPYKLGAILFSLLPPDIRSGAIPCPNGIPSSGHEDSTPQILAAPLAERELSYRSIIRSAFAHRGSVLFVVPTAADCARYAKSITVGIEDRVVLFSSQQNKTKRALAYEQFSDLTKAKVVIATPQFAYLDRPDYTTIIVEHAASPHYVIRERPYLDHREALKILAKETGRAIILGDILPRTEDEYARRSEHYQALGEHPKRLDLPAKLTLITQTDKPTKDVPFQLFSPELLSRMTHTAENRQNSFLFAARRGLAPVVACYDCGDIFRCPDSGTPYSLLRTYDTFGNEQRWFVSSTSGKRTPAADVCSACGSWRLRERGIGIQHIYDECRRHFPHTPIFLFDHTTATTHAKSVKIINDFSNTKGAILLGTAMTLPYIQQPVAISAVVSLDATRCIPSWRADEQLFRLLLTLREMSQKEVLVQSRQEPDDLLLYATRGAVKRFFDDELALREMLHYPPFANLFLLTWQGNQLSTTETEKIIKHTLKQVTPTISGQYYTNPNSSDTKIVRHCLLRITDAANTAPLIDCLRSLPAHIAITRNPDRIV